MNVPRFFHSRTKTCTLLPAVIFLLAALPSCTLTPETTVLNFADAMWAEDFQEAKKYCTPKCIHETLKYLEYTYMLEPGVWTGEGDPNKWDWAYWRSHLEVEMDGDTALVWQTDYEEDIFHLVKVDGKWMIDELEFDWGFDFDEFKQIIEREALHGF